MLVPENKADFMSFLSETNSRNFFWFGHGEADNFGYRLKTNGTSVPYVYVGKEELRIALNNRRGKYAHPYRLVMLYGCDTADSDLSTAFGIDNRGSSVAEYGKKGLKSRAYIGAKGICGYYQDTQDINGLGDSFNIFYTRWMQNFSIGQCLSEAQGTQPNPIAAEFTIQGAVDMDRNSP